MVDDGVTRTRTVIIGAGFGGIGLGIKLKQAGMNDFVVLEKSGSIGGVWRDNRYPGAACDVPSHLYSFSFVPWAGWSQKYATQPDILNYLKHCVGKHDLERHIRFNNEVTSARWDVPLCCWVVQTRDGHVFEAQSLVSATGQLSRALRPQLPGLAGFCGAVFHSSEWLQDYDLRGRRVAVVGSGASAIQFVPAIAPLVSTLFLFQRSAAYVLPKPDKAYSGWQKFLFKHIPGALRLSRLVIYLRHELTAFAFVAWPTALEVKRPAFRRHLRQGVKDPQMRRRLTPNYHIGCKRLLLSNDFYVAMDRANVELITDAICEIRTDSIVAVGGVERKIDCIILGTGFLATDFLAPIKFIGAGGRDLHQAWRGAAEAYLGITIAGFPNFFMLYGPNTNLAHNSVVYMIESQIRYVMTCLARLQRNEIRVLEVKQDAQDRFNAHIHQRLHKTVWAKGCTNWYGTNTGRNTTNWPGHTIEYMLRTRAPRWDDYLVR